MIEVGQIWADNDKRSPGRRFKIVAIDGDYAVCEMTADRIPDRNGKHPNLRPPQGFECRVRVSGPTVTPQTHQHRLSIGDHIMKIIDVEQNSPEWYAARLGRPTASQFHRIVTAARGELSKSARAYAAALVAEHFLRRPLEKPPGSVWAMERGKRLEPRAVEQYAWTYDVKIQRVGLVTTNDGRLACSPDGLIVGERGGVEFKCCIDENHMSIYFDGPGDDYKQQVQGNLAIAELEWWDLYAYHPELPPRRIRTYRDEPYITKMSAALTEFLAIRDEMIANAIKSGEFQQIANDNAPKQAVA